MSTTEARHPLACPRCGCPESYVLRTRAWTQGSVAKPLPAKRRTRQCTSCGKQFHTTEAIER